MAYFKLDIDKFPKTTPENARHQFQGLAHLAELAYRYDGKLICKTYELSSIILSPSHVPHGQPMKITHLPFLVPHYP